MTLPFGETINPRPIHPVRTAWYWTTGVNSARCKYKRCRARIVLARNASTGRWAPFDGQPRAIRTELRDGGRIGERRQAMLVDMAQLHFHSCVGHRDEQSRRPR